MRHSIFILLLLFPFFAWAEKIIVNPSSHPSLVNSVEFHPTKKWLAITYTTRDRVDLYNYEEEEPLLLQSLEAPGGPQYALFLEGGDTLLVVSWGKGEFQFFPSRSQKYVKGNVQPIPPFGRGLKPHGVSCTKGGTVLAIAFGAQKTHGRAVALYSYSEGHMALLDWMSENELLEGIPKGIAFSPDENSLLVTFALTDQVAQYPIDWETKKIGRTPVRILTEIARGEDIAFPPSGEYFALSQSGADLVSFHRFVEGEMVEEPPFQILGGFEVPHGVAFSPDGDHFAVTQFGPVEFGNNEEVRSWGNERKEWVFLFNVKDL